MPARLLALVVIVAVAFCPLNLFSHPGRTDANGGHHDRKNGGYHYHNGGTRATSPPASTYKSPTPSYGFSSPPVVKKATPARQKGHFWHNTSGTTVGQGDILKVDLPAGLLHINDGRDSRTLHLDELAVIDQAYALDTDPEASKFRHRNQRWMSAGGEHTTLAMPTKVSKTTVTLRNAKGKSADVQLDRLNDESRELAAELRMAAETIKAKRSKQTISPFAALETDVSPFEFGDGSVQSAALETRKLGYWLTSSSNVRHNSGCRYYENSKGRACSADEGKPCEVCGG
jgi:hypothetical protein